MMKEKHHHPGILYLAKKMSVIEEKLLPLATSKIKEGFMKNIYESQNNKK